MKGTSVTKSLLAAHRVSCTSQVEDACEHVITRRARSGLDLVAGIAPGCLLRRDHDKERTALIVSMSY